MASLIRYSQRAGWIGAELPELLSEAESAALREELIGMGEDEWMLWEYENRSEANDFLRATPAQRARKKRWREPTLRARLALAAHRQARLASAVLCETDVLVPGLGYRDMTAAAAMAAFAVFREARWRWPFGGPAPFPEWDDPQE